MARGGDEKDGGAAASTSSDRKGTATDDSEDLKSLSRIMAVSDGGGAFVDAADASSRVPPRENKGGPDGEKGGRDGDDSSVDEGEAGASKLGSALGSTLGSIRDKIASALTPTEGTATSVSKRQYWWITVGALWASSLTSGALSMVLLLNSLKERHSVLQIAIIFAGYQFAGTAGALVGGNLTSVFGLRTMMASALALQSVATAAFIPMRHAHRSFGTSRDVDPAHVPTMSIGAATAYATVVQLVNGVARVVVRMGTKTLPRLVTPDVKRTASKRSAGRSERGLMWKTALVNGGRTFVRGGGFFVGGALLTLGFTNALVVLSVLTMPGFFIVLFVLPDVVGKRTGAVSWSPRELFCFSRGVTVTTAILLLQNAAQFAWLQVPLTTLLRNKTVGAFRMSHLGVSAIMSGVQMYEGMQSSVLGIPLLRWLRQTPPNTSKWTLALWSAAAALGCVPLIVLSFGTGLFYADSSTRAAASGSFFGSLFCLVFPMQVSNLIGSFVYQHFVDRTRVGTTSGFNTAMQAAGRGLGTLGSGVVFALLSGNDGDQGNPVPGFGGSVGITCAVMSAAAVIAVFGYSDERYGNGGVLNCGPCLSVRVKGDDGGGGGGRGGAPSTVEAATAEAKEEAASKGDGAGSLDAVRSDVEKGAK